ncbi:oxidoreductase, short chain dehydrogenase/reductase family [Synechococcus sp. PCC 7335]|uniref:SDR family NAD(P)-dependent oxidoreductase n=1 Tax=Synechococcus sp. (strain ATCC 29403 / PCC 7335) TaxID=91464 RepID=UPI00017EC748|nr:SDR family oxidoreductase [Synechococcus sp. PCC 7335]EDX87139.1 oxidoreductase, short chain dehydrogenase/reductase family [Synechococcus sp. PCC 7335]
MSKTLLVVGASRGIGGAIARHFHHHGHCVYSVSRTAAQAGKWISADISTAAGIQKVIAAIGDSPLDALLYMGGVWEKDAFTDAFNFQNSSDEETRFVLAVNLVAPIELTKGLAKNLAMAENPRALYIGSLSGLEHSASKEVANTASKFGLRGAVQSLRLALSYEGIGFTLINPGNIATEEVISDIETGRFSQQTPIPMTDIIETVEWVLARSAAVDVGEINLFQR